MDRGRGERRATPQAPGEMAEMGHGGIRELGGMGARSGRLDWSWRRGGAVKGNCVCVWAGEVDIHVWMWAGMTL